MDYLLKGCVRESERECVREAGIAVAMAAVRRLAGNLISSAILVLTDSAKLEPETGHLRIRAVISGFQP